MLKVPIMHPLKPPPPICSGVVIALALSFTYICLLRWLAGVIVGIGIAACFVLILASKLSHSLAIPWL